MNSNNKKYHQLVILWITDSSKFTSYLQQVAPVVQRYGGAADRSFVAESIWPQNMELPHIINLVHYTSKEAYADFINDPDFKKIKHLRDESTRIIAYEGYLTLGDPVAGSKEERLYNIEIIRYKNGSPEAYRLYEQQGEEKMKAYCFSVEFAMKPDSMADNPDLIKISFFRSKADKENFEKDPMHPVIEQELYPGAVDNVIWITGKSNPAMPEE